MDPINIRSPIGISILSEMKKKIFQIEIHYYIIVIIDIILDFFECIKLYIKKQ